MHKFLLFIFAAFLNSIDFLFIAMLGTMILPKSLIIAQCFQ